MEETEGSSLDANPIHRDPREVLSAARSIAGDLPRYEPPYEFPILFVPGYEELLSRASAPVGGIEDLYKRALERGRVIIHGEGGSGKTSVLLQLFRLAIADAAMPVVVELSRWLPSFDVKWRELEDSDLGQMDFLLSELASPATTVETLGPGGEELRILVLVDGLNEVERDIGNEVLAAIDAFTAYNPKAGVVVTDRLTRRSLSEERWTIATIGALYGEEGLRGIAFFRDRLGPEKPSSESMTAIQHDYFSRHVNLTEDEIRRAAAAAFEAYLTTRSRSFSLESFKAAVGESVLQRMQAAGVLLVEGDRARFQHHLYHDYLASTDLAGKPHEISREVLDAVTFKASSFDILAMTLEQMPDPAAGDRFVRRVYDWNFYGAAYALARSTQNDTQSVSSETIQALLFVLAERQWDPIRATATQVKDALHVFDTELSRRLLAANSPDEVREVALTWVDSRGPLRSWLKVFTIPATSDVTDELLHLIDDEDSFLGWTASNALKRARLTESQQEQLRRRLNDSPVTVRWRAAHALGGHPGNENIAALFQALADQDYWVKYGALRSLVSCTAEEPSVAPNVFAQLAERVELLLTDPDLLRSLERFLVLNSPPPNWALLVGPLIKNLWQRASTEEGQDRWKRLADRLTSLEHKANVS